MKIHTGNKPYKCSQCDKKNHILQSICGVTLGRDHINAVNVRKLFQQISFKKKQHMRSHTGDKPY